MLHRSFVQGIQARIVHAETPDLWVQLCAAQPKSTERLIHELRHQLVIIGMERAEPDTAARNVACTFATQ